MEIRCYACKGRGWYANVEYRDYQECPLCRGTGVGTKKPGPERFDED